MEPPRRDEEGEVKEKLLALAEKFHKEAAEYHRLAKEGEPFELRQEWEGVAQGLDRAATVLTAEAWSPK
jgi:hypothetical protein